MPSLPRRFRRRPDTGAVEICFKHDGRRYRRSYPASMPDSEALRLGRLFRESVLRGGTVVDCRGLSTIAMIEKWLKTGAAVRRCEAALTNARGRCKAIDPWVRGVPLDQLSSERIREIRLAMDATHRPWYVYGIMSDLRAMLRYAVEIGELERSPFPRGVMPRIPERAPDRLSDEQVDRLLQDLEASPRYWFFELMLLTGLRWCEMRSLEARHVLSKPYPHLLIEFGKSKRIRRIPLCDRAAEILRPRVGNHVGRLVSYASNAGGLVRRCSPDWHWHVQQLRHTFACRYIEAGGSLAALQRLLGHRTIQTTMIYASASDTLVMEEFRRVEERLVPRRGTTAPSDGVIPVAASSETLHPYEEAREKAT